MQNYVEKLLPQLFDLLSKIMPGRQRPTAYMLVRRVTRMLCEYGEMDLAAFFIPSHDQEGCWYRVCTCRGKLHKPKRAETVFDREYALSTGTTVLGPGFTGDLLGIGVSNLATTTFEKLKQTKSDLWLHEKLANVGLINSEIQLIGCPIASTFRKEDAGPYGGILCARVDSPNKITMEHATLLSSFGLHISYIVDTDIRFYKQRRSRNAMLRIDHIWQRDLSFTKKCAETLRIVQGESPFPRFLLSLVNVSGTQVCGVATAGFLDDLVQDTARDIFETAPNPPESEDILARVIRLRICDPFTVDPAKPEDPWAVHLHKSTMLRHQVNNCIRVTPLVTNGDRVIGVLLAEYPSGSTTITEDDNFELSAWTERLTGHVVSELQRLSEKRSLESTDRINAAFDLQFQSNDGSADGVLRTAISELCTIADVNQAAIYSTTDNSGLLLGRVGQNVNEMFLKRALYDDVPGELAKDHRSSIARRTVLSGQFEFVDKTGNDRLVHQSDREQLGISTDGQAVGIPLKAGASVIGAAVVFGPGAVSSIKANVIAVERIASISAKSIMFERTVQSHKKHQKRAVCEAVIIEQIGHLAALTPIGGTESLREITTLEYNKLELILRDASQVFSSDDLKLYVPDNVIVLPRPSSDRHSSRNQLSNALKNQPCYLSCAIGKSETESRGKILDRSEYYDASMVSLTSTVLQTLRPQLCDNVEESRIWSRKPDSMSGILRSWMGIPIVLQDENETRIYGLLSFTKFRNSNRDQQVFTKSDLTVALSICELLAIALRNRQSLREAQDYAMRMLTWFRHDVPMRIKVMEDNADCILSGDLNDGEKSSRTKVILDSAVFLQNCVSAYASLVDKCAVSKELVEISKIFNSAVMFARPSFPREMIDIISEIAPDARSDVYLDPRHLQYILFALLSNAGESFADVVGSEQLKILFFVDKSEDKLHFTIRDNGCGIDKAKRSSVWEAGVSFRRSSGLGLAIVKRLVQIGGGEVAEIEDGIDGKGTCVRFSLSCLRHADE